jgi:Galactose oxidase-like, Early set domain/Fibronectin type III domain/Glyoxal oxidase N-terminus
MTLIAGRLDRWAVLLALCVTAAFWAAVGSAAARAGTATPAFVQAATGHSSSVASLSVTPGLAVTVGNRLVVEVGVWGEASPTAASVTDSAGNGYVELLHFRAADKTEMSIWTAPVTAGGGTRPAIKVTPSSKADVGVVALEYAGVSTVSNTSVLDQSIFDTGTTGAAETVLSGATPPTTGSNELAIGFYLDSGFGDTLSGGPGFTTRANVSPDGNVELLAQDAVVPASATPNPAFKTGAMTTWLTSTVVLLAGESGAPTVPAAPTAVNATAGNASATVAWTSPSSVGSPITSYTVTPYVGTVAQPAATVTGSPPATSATVTGLTNGTAYTFAVTATNAVGTGPASAASSSVTPSAEAEGEWGPLTNWPFVAIHLFLLSTGHVLAFDGWQQPEPTYTWNPTTQEFTSATAPDSIFCSGMAQLPNGEVMTVGGYGGLTTGNTGIVDTSIFNPATATWTRVANMHDPRWYPSVTELADGDYVAISGNSTNSSTWADTPEVYDPTTNTWTLLSKVSTSEVHEEEYPFSYLAPNGNVFTIGPSEDVSYELNVENQTWTPVGGPSGITNGSSVMYRPGKILYSGGAPSVTSTTSAAAATSIIDLTAATPKWQQTAPMRNARIYHTLTMLANGEVLAVGGEPTSDQEVVTSGVLPTEIWNPATETWSPAAPIAAARNYHSTAILMPNATVLVAGGGHPNGVGDPGEFSAQTYSPPYLFDGPRPTIASSPASSTYNTSITVATPDAASISAVNLVSLGADTHQGDMAQHFVPLSFTANSGSLTVQAPANSALAPYGNYMLFLVNNKGVPSVSAPLNLSATPSAPAAPTGVSATAAAGSATVTWTAPSPGTSPITSYTVTPYVGVIPQPATTVTGSPPATSATVTGLTNGTAYTFVVTATNAVGTGPASAASNSVTPSAPTAPAASKAVTGTPGNASATVSWTAPANDGSPITSYAVTPYVGTVAQPATTVTGSPPATSATVTGLTNGTTYTFTVTATNAVGTGPASEASNAVTPTGTSSPAFVQQVSGHAHKVASLAVTPATSLTAGNRLVVEVGVWSNAKATASSVKDSAGDTFTELLRFKASDGTELSVWSAPVSAGGGARPTITATPTAVADVGVAALEYSGLSSAAGTAVVDQTAQATGTTKAAAVVATAATAPTTGPGELVLGLYADSGFDDNLMARMGFNGRVNVSPTEDVELVAEDALTGGAGATPSASVQTGASTVWLMATVVLKPAPAAEPPAAPDAAPALLVATPADRSATVTWRSPSNGGSPITTYTVTPYAGSRRLRSMTVSGTSAVVGGLRNGVRYRFSVAARNVLGTGPTSAFTNAVKPSAALVWAFWCTPFPMEAMHIGALDIYTPWAGEVLLPGEHAKRGAS